MINRLLRYSRKFVISVAIGVLLLILFAAFRYNLYRVHKVDLPVHNVDLAVLATVQDLHHNLIILVEFDHLSLAKALERLTADPMRDKMIAEGSHFYVYNQESVWADRSKFDPSLIAVFIQYNGAHGTTFAVIRFDGSSITISPLEFKVIDKSQYLAWPEEGKRLGVE